MITPDQKRIISDFFANMVSRESARSMSINLYVPDFGTVVALSCEERGDLGSIAVRGLRTFAISDLVDAELTSFVSFIQEMNTLRDGVKQIFQTTFPSLPFDLFFDLATAKQTRFLFINNLPNCDYLKEYKAISLALTSFGYTVNKDPQDSSVAFIIKYKADYLAKSNVGKFLYNISHIG